MYKSHGSGWSGLDGISFAESGVDACVEVPKCMKLKLSSRVLYISCTSGCQSRGKWERSGSGVTLQLQFHLPDMVAVQYMKRRGARASEIRSLIAEDSVEPADVWCISQGELD